jgi:serine/threonine-protein kinase
MATHLALLPGQQIGGYTVIAPLRSGGMASLYLAESKNADGSVRQVAVKVIHPHLVRDVQFVRMFVDEARLCERIRHPNVVHAEPLGESSRVYYLAMEYVEGRSLCEILDRICSAGEAIAPSVAVSIACSVLEGLDAAHQLRSEQGEPLGVVHRDVSPSNILISTAGDVKLIDFGIAKARGRAAETSAGTLKGKFAYMSPEQAMGRDVDHRSDLYAVGVVLWEMLALRALFFADSDLALLEKVRCPTVPSLAPKVSQELDAVLRWALQPDREQRSGSARALRKALLEAVPEAKGVARAQVAALIGSHPCASFSMQPTFAGANDATIASQRERIGQTPYGSGADADSSKRGR